MDYLFNSKRFERTRRCLRTNVPQPERALWSKLRNNQLAGFKFRRQYGVGGYILDFYCPAARLAIEIDGESHSSSKARNDDHARDGYLRNLNIQVLRFTNEEVTKNIDGVIIEIGQHLLPHPASPKLGEGLSTPPTPPLI